MERPGNRFSRIPLLNNPFLLIPFIAGFSFLLYANALRGDFVLDDKFQVVRNMWIRDFGNVRLALGSHFWGFYGESANYYRPFIWVIHTLGYRLFWLEPYGYHLINVLFHAACSVLVFLIAQRVLERKEAAASRIPLAASLLFAAHPVHTEGVAWISAVSELSFSFFFLLAFYFHLKGKEERGMRGLSLALSLVSFAVSLFSKESAVMFPFIILAYASLLERERLPVALKRSAPYLLIAGFYLILRFSLMEGVSAGTGHDEIGPWEMLINIGPIFTKGMEKLLIPLNLNAFYTFHVKNIFEPREFFSIGILALFSLLVLFSIKKDRAIAFGLLFMFLTLMPAFYIKGIITNTFAERYLYLPSAGFLLSATLFARNLLRKKFLFPVFIILLLSFYSWGTISRNPAWRDDLAILSDMVEKNPEAGFAHYLLANELLERGRPRESVREYELAARSYPEDALLHNNMGLAYARAGMREEALREFRTALSLSPDMEEAKGNMLSLMGGRLEQDSLRDSAP